MERRVASVGGATQSNILAAMGFAVFRRTAEDGFQLEGQAPYWYLRLLPEGESAAAPVQLDERFPFLSSFLPTAQGFWGAGKDGRIRSEMWTESLEPGKDLALEASALRLEGEDFLLIEHSRNAFERDKGYLQKGRELRLRTDEIEGRVHSLLAADRRFKVLLDGMEALVLRTLPDGTVVERYPLERGWKPTSLAAVVGAGSAAAIALALTAQAPRTPQQLALPSGARVRLLPLEDGSSWILLPRPQP